MEDIVTKRLLPSGLKAKSGGGGDGVEEGGDCCGWQVSVADRGPPPQSARGKSYASIGLFGVK